MKFTEEKLEKAFTELLGQEGFLTGSIYSRLQGIGVYITSVREGVSVGGLLY